MFAACAAVAEHAVGAHSDEVYAQMQLSGDAHAWLSDFGDHLVRTQVPPELIAAYALAEGRCKREFLPPGSRFLGPDGEPNDVYWDATRWHAHRVAVHDVCQRVHELLFVGNTDRDPKLRVDSYRAVTDLNYDNLWIRIMS